MAGVVESSASAPGAEAAAAAATSEGDTVVELRAELVEKLKASRAAREAGAGEPEKPKKPEKSAKPDAKKPDAKGGDADAAHDDDTPEQAQFKAERRAFAKQKRKKDAEFQAREQHLQQFESRAQQMLEAFDKDPIAWLKAHKVNVRATLLKQANEDAEDPRDKKLRELEESQKSQRAELEREKTERAQREAGVQQAEAIKSVEAEMGKAWQAVEVDDYPTVATALEPEHVAQRAAEILIDHFRDWDKNGRVGKYKELAPSKVFAIMEEELAPLKGKLANGVKKPKPPEQVRAASEKPRKAATPEAPTKRERPKDVTRSATREPTLGRPTNFDREAIRERLVDRVRSAAR
jgi:hypothetical protein